LWKKFWLTHFPQMINACVEKIDFAFVMEKIVLACLSKKKALIKQ